MVVIVPPVCGRMVIDVCPKTSAHVAMPVYIINTEVSVKRPARSGKFCKPSEIKSMDQILL